MDSQYPTLQKISKSLKVLHLKFTIPSLQKISKSQKVLHLGFTITSRSLLHSKRQSPHNTTTTTVDTWFIQETISRSAPSPYSFQHNRVPTPPTFSSNKRPSFSVCSRHRDLQSQTITKTPIGRSTELPYDPILLKETLPILA